MDDVGNAPDSHEEPSNPSLPSKGISPNELSSLTPSSCPSPQLQSRGIGLYSDIVPCSSTAASTEAMSLESVHSSLPTLSASQDVTLHPTVRPKVKFIGTLKQIKCDGKGGRYNHTVHGIAFYIPPGAVNEGSTLTLTFGVATVGPFKYPDNTTPVSPVLWLQVVLSNGQVVLKKTLEIRIPHAVTGDDGMKHLRFLCCSKLAGTIVFERAHKKSTIGPNEGVLHTKLSKNSYCFCISSKVCLEFIASTQYCIVKVRPLKLNPSNTWKMHFFVTYALSACIEVSRHEYILL